MIKRSLIFCLILPLIASCVKEEEPLKGEKKDPYCASLSADAVGCGAASPEWVILVKRSNFPERIRLLVNGQTIIDECQPSRVRYQVNRRANLTILETESFMGMSQDSNLTFEIRNLGNCYENSNYYSEKNQKFKLKKQDGKYLVWIEVQ